MKCVANTSPAILAFLVAAGVCHGQSPRDYPIRPIPSSASQIHDSFWKPRLDINRRVSIPHNFRQCQLTGRIGGFLHAAQGTESKKKGPSWWDSDVYKVIEGASYCLGEQPDPGLENYLELLISVIASAQKPDGYLHTFRTINPRHEWNGPTRFSHPISHEFFNAGHLYEAAIAHHQATGRRDLLDIAVRNAELVFKTFGNKKFGDGGPDMVIFPDHSQFDFGGDDFSVQLWFKPHAASRMGLFSGATDHWFGLDFHNQGERNVCLWASRSGNGWDLIHGDAGGQGIGKIPLGLDEWNHIAAVRQGDRWRTYINGQLDVDIVASGIVVDRDETKQLGMWADVGNWVNGAIDDFAIFDRALTAEQVQTFYNKSTRDKPKVPRPTGHWTMDGAALRTVRDLSRHENHASMRGAERVTNGALTYTDNRALDFVGDTSHYKSDHPEIELALVKLSQQTGQEKYLDLAKYLTDHRLVDWRYTENATRYEAREHIVASTYAWCGMTDLFALQRAPNYGRIIDSLWENVVSRKLYITGGIGSRGEHFAADYVLPNSGLETDRPPSVETCGAIGLIFWNHRLFLLHGDAKYIDVLERTLYNAVPPTVSLAGDTFTYANPLAHDGKFTFNMGFPDRQPFLMSACCPTNVVRFLPQIPSLIYAQRDNDVYVNLFVESSATIDVGQTKVQLKQTTSYPSNGRITIQVTSRKPADFSLRVRIPGWAQNRPVPSDLYRYLRDREGEPSLWLNDERVRFEQERGYAVITRTWKKGDTVVLDLPMPVRRVISHASVENNRGKVALERGPIVYCAEGVDNDGKALDLVLADDAKLQAKPAADRLTGTVIIQARNKQRTLTAVPYHSWQNRGQTEMTVWFAREVDE